MERNTELRCYIGIVEMDLVKTRAGNLGAVGEIGVIKSGMSCGRVRKITHVRHEGKILVDIASTAAKVRETQPLDLFVVVRVTARRV